MLIAEPVFSPDGQSLVFVSVADRTLKRIAVGGGPAVTMGPVELPFSLSWAQNAIFMAQPGRILRIPDEGREAGNDRHA